MKKSNKKPMSIVKKIAIAVVSGFIVGIICLLIKNELLQNNYPHIWMIIDKVLFQDITTQKGINGIGLFFIIGQLFMNGLQLGIVPLVLVSLSLAMCSIAQPGRLGKIAGKTIGCFLIFYIVSVVIAGSIAYIVKNLGFFDVNLPEVSNKSIQTLDRYNPLTIITDLVPSNIISVLGSNNEILSVVVIAIIIGMCMHKIPNKTEPIKAILQSSYDILLIYLEFIINKIGPIAIFCMIVRTFAIYGLEYLKPTAAFIITGIATGLFLVLTIYPIGIFLTTRLNPLIFMKKMFKVGLFAAATNSSAATLPLNMKTCTEELGCSKEISSFVMPTGMTINMNGTSAMHMIAVTFIAVSAGIDITPTHLVIAGLISITVSIGVPAIPVAGTTMVFSILTGLGFTSDAAMLGYAIVVAMSYPVGMAVITMNVVGDAATNVIVCVKEGELDESTYYS